MATSEQMATIRAMRVDSVARAMMTEGIRLSWEQASLLGDECTDWLRSRLGLHAHTDNDGVTYSP